jgi:FtsZ-binding cell division protein ZapB
MGGRMEQQIQSLTKAIEELQIEIKELKSGSDREENNSDIPREQVGASGNDFLN